VRPVSEHEIARVNGAGTAGVHSHTAGAVAHAVPVDCRIGRLDHDLAEIGETGGVKVDVVGAVLLVVEVVGAAVA
jgi:hypothetical protein